jgi:hypothetical protein
MVKILLAVAVVVQVLEQTTLVQTLQGKETLEVMQQDQHLVQVAVVKAL